MKNTINCIFLLLIILCFISCKQNDTVTILNYMPDDLISSEDVTLKIEVYHSNGIVNKTILIEELKLEDDNLDQLKELVEMYQTTFSGEYFDYEGISYKDNMNNDRLTTHLTFDFTTVDISILNDEILNFIGGRELFDADNNLIYDKLIDKYKEVGFEVEKER